MVSVPSPSTTVFSLVKLYFEDGSWVICRFSGTEPLLRMAAEGESTEQADGYIAAWQNLLNL